VPKTFADISIDEILNYQYADTALMARYERIMQHRTIEAMNGLSGRLDEVVNKLEGVMETIHRVGQLAQDKADKAILAADTSSKVQIRQQRAMYFLTGALVICTIAYTTINYLVWVDMRAGNDIQLTISGAVKEQAAAARESNNIQRILLVPKTISPIDKKNAKADHGTAGHSE
jgi:hypothetical protein